MEPSKLKLLEEKYWAGETDAQEEEQLRHFALTEKSGLSQEFIALVSANIAFARETTSAEFDDKFWNRVEENRNGGMGMKWLQFATYTKYAAALIVLAAIGLAIYSIAIKSDSGNENTIATEEFQDTYTDPEQAFEETKRALLMVSSKLNEAEQPILELKRFHESKMSITGSTAVDDNK